MRSSALPPGAAGCAASLLLAALVLAGCAASGNSSSQPSLLDKLLPKASVESDVAPSAQSEGCGTPAQCRSALKKIVDSPKRGWVGQQQAPGTYTNGTRLFAYRALRTKLTCRELSLALTEVRAVSKSLAGDVPGTPPDQATRTRALSGQVETELSRERGSRCARS
jgi:hypothetical protein